MKIDKGDALKSLRPGCSFVLRDNNLEWLSPNISVPTDKEIEEEIERLILEQPAKNARAKRDALLIETDWMALSDVNITTEWIDYRQALRDVPQQPGFPDNIEWPEKPK